MQVTIQITGLKEVQAQLGTQAKQAAFAASRALNTTAFAVNDRLKKDMAATFKGGATAYTLRAFKVTKADKASLTAEVNLRTDAPDGGTPYAKALGHLFTGGARRFKKIEGFLRGRGILPAGLVVVPGEGMPLDSFGNMRRNALTELLGVVGNQRTNLRVYRRTGAGKAQKAVGYFVARPGDKSRKAPGIYKRIETGTTSAIVPMILFVDPRSYRQFVDLDKLGNDVVGKTFQPAFDAELVKALANAK